MLVEDHLRAAAVKAHILIISQIRGKLGLQEFVG
jgi:hypothetical protein